MLKQETSSNCLSLSLFFIILFVCPYAAAYLSSSFSLEQLALGKTTHFNIQARLHLLL